MSSATRANGARFRVSHLWLPTLAFVAAFAGLEHSRFDVAVTGSFYDPAIRDFPAREGWWAKELVHEYGRALIIGVIIAAAIAWLASRLSPALAPLRRPATYVLAVYAVVNMATFAGQQLTNVQCPWKLAMFGGDRPYVRLLEPRRPRVHAGHCFPGRHSSGGYALFAFYFLWRHSHPSAARAALAGALTLGSVFALAQWMRGAHFPSHDLWSAWLCWMWALALDRVLLRAPRVRDG